MTNPSAKPSSETLTLLERVREFPAQPGVYLMKDSSGRILYVGKAKSLRSRVRSYFQQEERLADRTRLLVRKIHDIEITVTNTELEALLLECNLIKKHRPRYNVRLKDDKNYPYVVLDFTHPFPQIRIARRVVLSPQLKYFGPFSGGVTEISRFLLKTFQIRDCSDAKFKNRSRPCLNYEIGTCTAPCVNYVSQEDYAKQVQEAVLFLKGKKQQLLRSLNREMKQASDEMQYERAKLLRDKIYSVEKLTQKQDAILPENQIDIDVIGSYESAGQVQWVVLFLRSGLLTGRRSQKARLDFDGMEDATRSFLEQFYTVSLIPDEVWISDDFPDRSMLEEFLSERAAKRVQVRVRRSEAPMRLLGMAHENAKLLFHEGEHRNKDSGSIELQKVLSLKECPHSIEGIDISNLQGTKPVASVVHFADERPLKSRYRLFYPRSVEGQDDFAMIYETCLRRFSNLENPPPDLLLIDGGKGQLQSAMKALEELKMEIPLCSLAKSRTESSFTLKTVEKSEERIFVPFRKNPIVLREGHPALRLLQQVRDEAHRFAIKSHRARRKKGALQESEISVIPGVGDKTRARLLKHFGSLEAIKAASEEELIAAGVNRKVAAKVREHFRKESIDTDGGNQ
jgi:excinuclease ABC subunit C